MIKVYSSPYIADCDQLRMSLSSAGIPKAAGYYLPVCFFQKIGLWRFQAGANGIIQGII